VHANCAHENTILALFMLKALLIGFAGAAAGCLIGVTVGAVWGEMAPWSRQLLRPSLFLAALLAAPALCILAAWIPAVRASRQDPAQILRED